MIPKPFPELAFEHIILTTPGGDISGLFSDLRVDITTIPEGLTLYNIRHSDDDDSVPITIEPRVYVNCFGTIIVNSPLDFGSTCQIEILDCDFIEM
ncbi:MAG: hypothetical protein LBV38_00865 [Alistipes sp.]|jgi:hypothetical protein|nr:hypothetical protein [Alistipes sp.]